MLVVFHHIQEAILADDELRPLFRSNVTAKSLTHETTGIVIQIISCSMKNAVGRRPVLLLLDELHEMADAIGMRREWFQDKRLRN